MRVEEIDYLTSENVKNMILAAGGEVRKFRVGAQKDKYIILYDTLGNYYRDTKSIISIKKNISTMCPMINREGDHDNYYMELEKEEKDKIEKNDKKLRIVLETLNKLAAEYSKRDKRNNLCYKDPYSEESKNIDVLLATFDNLSTVYWGKYDQFETLQRLVALENEIIKLKRDSEQKKRIEKYEREMESEIRKSMMRFL